VIGRTAQFVSSSINSIKQSIHMSYKTTTKTRLISVASILASSFLILSGTVVGNRVQAAEAPPYDTTIVAFGDLNLDSEQGIKALYARLRNGAEDVCASFEGRDLFFKKAWQKCFDQAMAIGVAQVNRPSLTTLHNQTVSRSKGYR
jgi:UrcA family protein